MTNVLEYLEYSAKQYPDKLAVVDPTARLTYDMLLENAKSIGSGLLHTVQPRQPVAVCMEKSVQAYAALMGIVYAGCFYVYIDTEQAPARMKQILSVCRPVCILSDHPEQLSACDCPVLRPADLMCCPVEQSSLQQVREQALDTDPLYCNFTSGSTGVPKGVLVSHRSVIDFMQFFPDMFHITENDVIGCQAPFDFDVSVKDIYSSLKTGAVLVLIPRRYFSIVTQLLDYLCEYRVTTLIWAVSALCLVTQFKGFTYKIPSCVNKVLFSGELMPDKYLREWQNALPEAQFVNLYGPTEITCNCTYYRVDHIVQDKEQLPIGKAFPNERVFLLDEQNREVTQQDVIGELCVAGTALALGYYNNREMTEKAFVQNPLNPNYPEKIYRTGDLAVYDADGNLRFAGREDFQIKYMGHRIELEEIELVLNSLPEVVRSCCRFDTEHQRIVAYYSGDVEPIQLKKKLYLLLPQYMIPSRLHLLDSIPLTANGKLDRKVLKESEMILHG